jgi:hypothetical protein
MGHVLLILVKLLDQGLEEQVVEEEEEEEEGDRQNFEFDA